MSDQDTSHSFSIDINELLMIIILVILGSPIVLVLVIIVGLVGFFILEGVHMVGIN